MRFLKVITLTTVTLLCLASFLWAQFIPGDTSIPPESWNTWHGLAPGNKSKVLRVSFSGGSNDTLDFTWTMDYMWFFTKAADCSIRAVITPADLASGAQSQDIDTTNFIYVPAGSGGEINLQWSGVIVKGVGTGTFDGMAVGRTY